MKTTMTLIVAALFGLGACGGDEETAVGAFEGKTELEMFTMVQQTLCDKFVACGSEFDPPENTTLEDCQASLDDREHYMQAINEEDRAQLELCLTNITHTPCTNFALQSQNVDVQSCQGIEK